MGGSIRVLVRHADGRVEARDAWTNNMPWWFTNLALVTDTEAHLTKYLDPERFEDGADLAPPRAPSGYGLVVVDAKEKLILHAQGYCSFGDDFVVGALNDFQGESDPSEANDPWVDEAFHLARIREFVRAGKITGVRFWDEAANDERVGTVEEAVGRPLPTWEDWFAWLVEVQKVRNARGRASFLQFDLSPWKIESFDEDRAGFEALRARLTAIGFEFDKRAVAAWKKWLARLGNDEGEE
jgi:hypothetical protein